MRVPTGLRSFVDPNSLIDYRRPASLPAWQNVAAGTEATLTLPPDRRYHQVFIEYSNANTGAAKTVAQILAEIERIEIKLNGVTQREITPAQLNAMMLLNGAQYGIRDGHIPIWFTEPWHTTPPGQDVFAWNTAVPSIQSFQIIVKLADAAVFPKLGGMSVEDGVNAGPGFIVKYTSQRPAIAAAGEVTLNDFPTPGLYKRMHFFENTADDLEKVKITRNNSIVWEMTRAQAVNYLSGLGFNPQAGVFPVQFSQMRRYAEGLHTGNTPLVYAQGAQPVPLRLDLTVGSADGLRYVAEIYGPPFQ